MKKVKIDQIKMGAVISYLALGLNITLGLLYTPWMKDRIGIDNHGLYTLAISLISIFMLDFGLGSAVSRFVAKYRAEGRQDKVDEILGVIFKLYLSIDIVVVAVLSIVYFLLGSIYKGLTSDQIEQFKILYIIVAGFNIISFPFSPLNGILNAYEKFIQLKICDLISKVSTVALVVIALCFSANVVWVVAANAAGGLLTIAVKQYIVRKNVPIKPDFKAGNKALYKSLFSFTIWATVVSIMQRFTHSFAPSVLGITTNAKEIGLYTPATVIEGYFYSIAAAVNGLFLPRISKYIANKKEESISNLMVKVGRYQLVFLSLIFIGFVCVGKDFMTTWMHGAEYAKTYYCAILILIPTLISATQQIANTTVIAKKLIKYHALCMIVTAPIGLAISYILSLYIGAFGVCIGTAVTSLVNLAYMNYVYQVKAGINMFAFYKSCYLRAVPCYILTISLGLICSDLIHIEGWLGVIVKGVVVIAIYTAVFGSLYFKNEEKRQFFQYVMRVLKRDRKNKK